ncbi:UNVERIFIED_ORG: hypothetical protein J2Y78_002053 [Buttiauxella agrestis ATCC 33320]
MEWTRDLLSNPFFYVAVILFGVMKHKAKNHLAEIIRHKAMLAEAGEVVANAGGNLALGLIEKELQIRTLTETVRHLEFMGDLDRRELTAYRKLHGHLTEGQVKSTETE